MQRIFLCVFWSFSIFVSLSSESARASYEYTITFFSKPPEIPPQWICNRVDKVDGDSIEQDLQICLQKMKFELPSIYTSKDADPELRRSIRVDISQNKYVSYPYLKSVYPNGDIVVVDYENYNEVTKVYVNNFSYIVGYPGNFNELLHEIKKHNVEHQRARPYKSSETLSNHLVKKQKSAPSPSYKNSFVFEKEKLSLGSSQSEKSKGKEEEEKEEYLTPELWLQSYTDCFLEREAKSWMSDEELIKIQPKFPYLIKNSHKFFEALKTHIEKELKEDGDTMFLTLLQILHNELHKIKDQEAFFRDESINSIILRYAQKSTDLYDYESLEPSSVRRVMEKLVKLLKSKKKQEQHRDLFKIYAVIFQAYHSLIREHAWGYDYSMKLTINVFFTRLITPILVLKAKANGSVEDLERVRRLQSTFALGKTDWLKDKVQYQDLREKILTHMSRNIMLHCPNM